MKYRYTAAYLLKHPIEKFSPAMILQDEIACPEDWEEIKRESYGAGWDRLTAEIEEEDTDGLFRLMRCDGASTCHFLVRRVALEKEEEMMPIIKRWLLTSMNEFFIDDAAYFMANCKEDCSSWILEHYKEVRSPYMQSQLCLALGFRSDLFIRDFLFGEVERFESKYPTEQYEQGPLLALDNLKVRYGRF